MGTEGVHCEVWRFLILGLAVGVETDLINFGARRSALTGSESDEVVRRRNKGVVVGVGSIRVYAVLLGGDWVGPAR